MTKIRAYVYLALLIAAILFLVDGAGNEAVTNIKRRGIPLTFDFWNKVSGFAINQALIPYSDQTTYG